jgi:hypothetical protein
MTICFRFSKVVLRFVGHDGSLGLALQSTTGGWKDIEDRTIIPASVPLNTILLV